VSDESLGEAANAPSLIREAFLKARDSGKPDWYRMRSAVLKNRLLLITAGRFDEEHFGARSFADFLTRFPELIRVDRSQMPPVVELIEAAASESLIVPRSTARGRPRLRQDLWQAMMDFSSGIEYVWDQETSHARARLPTDGDDVTRMPTVTDEELRKWRQDFVTRTLENASIKDGAIEERLNAWATKRLRTLYLPPEFRGPWNEFMRKAALEKLKGWFNGKGLMLPGDVIQQPFAETGVPVPSELAAALTNLLLRLSDAELSQLRLPATLVLRALQRH
jgi:hypothetical protein